MAKILVPNDLYGGSDIPMNVQNAVDGLSAVAGILPDQQERVLALIYALAFEVMNHPEGIKAGAQQSIMLGEVLGEAMMFAYEGVGRLKGTEPPKPRVLDVNGQPVSTH